MGMTNKVKDAITFARTWPGMDQEVQARLLRYGTGGEVALAVAFKILADEVDRLQAEEEREIVESVSS